MKKLHCVLVFFSGITHTQNYNGITALGNTFVKICNNFMLKSANRTTIPIMKV